MIKKYFIYKARYKAVDETGMIIWLNIDYWNNKFGLSVSNIDLENFARKLLKKKHKVNLVHKMLQ
ncbi:MAG: hypothetical protein UR39_C0002G0089 [Candidatus Woesebacteria bacterium GW2011_GWA1_33_30]|uniref:Uncharacterized protein n=1 Tax=Candidatus Woesebacteria bacterium GW2011_GWA2_33_28 TaxID=1618561 RepID=A0A0G0A9G7_9BACT|nr:MAG: hypothetical protein UR38_C0002G0089 [Candidatus Woesebacteria bacterium GW2011_GWA2_33_28]KKP48799.1 MAG: hypothetical protein UR39_C0002G0089 [Candidatus Woesebacteria bacterium GW2011_GWA1_33_30]KKP50072.1 MAG: hypothetical protein UR40_C0002G0089 [Microgenomates group bacterium GW2011_GWC1_33_32]KKP51843.1 MAG: hypothetical protein UR44_C0006G0089 [Candidatus Woesebacteria bacterium GW2011_GWB1_33_38]